MDVTDKLHDAPVLTPIKISLLSDGKRILDGT
jgi:hypothetical protein